MILGSHSCAVAATGNPYRMRAPTYTVQGMSCSDDDAVTVIAQPSSTSLSRIRLPSASWAGQVGAIMACAIEKGTVGIQPDSRPCSWTKTLLVTWISSMSSNSTCVHSDSSIVADPLC